MKDRLLNIYKFTSLALIIFSVTIIFITFIGLFVGESAQEYSTLFSLGSSGIAYDTILQMLLEAIIITTINYIFSSEKIFKNMLGLWKIILLLTFSFITTIIFIICFKWFPINLIEAWVGFILSFGGFFVLSTIIMVTKTNREAKKYDELLESYKKRNIERMVDINEDN